MTDKKSIRENFGCSLSWNAIDGIMQRAVKRGLLRRKEGTPKHIGVDETAFKKRHDYVTVVSDQESGHVAGLYQCDS
ncbi:MAG: hypothetical protein KAU17_14645 [Spirochaetales bacterium]|jgi:transposase|nr:hypothetical protein [Spirochaetales bacterium]